MKSRSGPFIPTYVCSSVVEIPETLIGNRHRYLKIVDLSVSLIFVFFPISLLVSDGLTQHHGVCEVLEAAI